MIKLHCGRRKKTGGYVNKNKYLHCKLFCRGESFSSLGEEGFNWDQGECFAFQALALYPIKCRNDAGAPEHMQSAFSHCRLQCGDNNTD